ncbi:MAG TPA: hypothetical protein VM029_07515, partial [Opitutaceae bacterium]|nr:hypothetical protein [Opitutaceae bacterium]
MARRGAGEMKRGILAFLAAVVSALGLRAHDPGISTAQGNVFPDRLELTTGFAPADAQQLLPPAARTGEKWTDVEFATVQPQLTSLAPQLWEVRAGETVLA